MFLVFLFFNRFLFEGWIGSGVWRVWRGRVGGIIFIVSYDCFSCICLCLISTVYVSEEYSWRGWICCIVSRDGVLNIFVRLRLRFKKNWVNRFYVDWWLYIGNLVLIVFCCYVFFLCWYFNIKLVIWLV